MPTPAATRKRSRSWSAGRRRTEIREVRAFSFWDAGQSRHPLAVFARDPPIAGLFVFAFDGRPGDAMGELLALRRPAILIFDPGVIEGAPIDFLRMCGQMVVNGRRKIFHRCVGQASLPSVSGRRAVGGLLNYGPGRSGPIDPEQTH